MRAALAWWALSGTALAHGDEHSVWSELRGEWTVDLMLPFLLAAAVMYCLGVRRLWRRNGRPVGVRPWEVGAFVAAWGTLAVALLSPLDALSDVLFSAHMGQHELLMLIAAPLLVLGRPVVAYLWALPERPRGRVAHALQHGSVQATWKWLTLPFVALVAHGLTRWLWHAPALYEAALRSEAVHALQHAMFFSSAVLFWWALTNGRYGRAGYGVAVLFVFATAVHTSFLGALITFAPRVWYPLYEERARLYTLDALQDQQLAGLIMWVPAGMIFVSLGLGFFAAWLGNLERRAQLESPGRKCP